MRTWFPFLLIPLFPVLCVSPPTDDSRLPRIWLHKLPPTRWYVGLKLHRADARCGAAQETIRPNASVGRHQYITLEA